MVDLIPLLAFVAGGLSQLLLCLKLRGTREKGVASPLRRPLLLGAGIAVVALPYVTYLLVQEPDVRDFYASAWFVPLVVLGAMALWLAWLLRQPTFSTRTYSAAR